MHEQIFLQENRLYYQDSEQYNFQARVISCDKENDSRYLIVLDKTAFFPEGGGQAGDIGTIRITGDDDINPNVIPVLDTIEKDGEIYHVIDSEVAPGTSIIGDVDMRVRFDRMQQHTGEHIVSGIVHSLFGYTNVGFHLGDEITTLDFDGPINDDQLRTIEQKANEAVFQNIEIKTFFPTKEEEAEIDYRSKIDIEGQVRLVEIPGVDMCACCAPHVKMTGEVGLIKIVDAINYKGGMRLMILCGGRALDNYAKLYDDAKSLSVRLSVPVSEFAERTNTALDESESRRQQIFALEEKFMSQITPEQIGSASIVFVENIEADIVRNYVNNILAQSEIDDKIVAAFIGNDDDGYRYIIASNSIDLKSFAKDMNEKLDGKGGGKPQMIQGTLLAKEEKIREYFA